MIYVMGLENELGDVDMSINQTKGNQMSTAINQVNPIKKISHDQLSNSKQ